MPLAPDEIQRDAELIARLKGRDTQALSVLYDRYGAAAYALILRIIEDRIQSEALLAQTFLTIWNRAPGLSDKPVSLRFWTLWVARAFAIAHVSLKGKGDTVLVDALRCTAVFEYRERE